MTHVAFRGKEEVPYSFVTPAKKFGFGSNMGKIIRMVTAIKSLRFALL